MADENEKIGKIGDLNPWRGGERKGSPRNMQGSSNNTVASGVTAVAAVVAAIAASAQAAISANPTKYGRPKKLDEAKDE